MILKSYEAFGQESRLELGLPSPVEAWETDLIERPLRKVEAEGKMIALHFKPFEIKTIKVQAAGKIE